MKKQLKALRATRDLSQEVLSKQLGVSKQTINALERGK
jgi:putative transcriptional regulator